MGSFVSKLNSKLHSKLNMKLFGLVAFIGLAAAAPQKINANQALKKVEQLAKQQGLTKQKLNAVQKKAISQVNSGLKQAEQFAAKNGVNFDANKILKQLQQQYGAQAQGAINKAVNQGKAAFNSNVGTAQKQFNQAKKQANNLQSNSEFKNAQKQLNQMTFEGLLSQATKFAKQQINQVGNAEVRKQLNNIIVAGNKEAKKTLANNGLTGSVGKKAQAEFKKGNYQAQGKKLLDNHKNQAEAQLQQAQKNFKQELKNF